MDSDISLIEVAGEDDSLLQSIPEDDVIDLDNDCDSITAGKSSYFLCSPLLNVRSDGSNSCSSSDCIDKENINVANLEVPKLSIVPQQMKKKKKGGYNLRKSIAWNRAFFTEEGVLNPLELSLITGSTPRGEALEEIDEEMPTMFGGDYSNDSSSVDKSFKDKATSTPIGDKKSGRGLLPKLGSATKNNVRLKELLAKDVNRSGSKRGSCPRPVVSLSAKRPTTTMNTAKIVTKEESFSRNSVAKRPTTTMNTAKIVTKEEKFSRNSVPKRDSTVLSRNPKSASTIRPSDSKGNQVAQRVGANPKKTTLKVTSINTLYKDGNASIKAKTTIPQLRRKLTIPVRKVDSSRSQHEPSSDSNKGLEVATNSLFSKTLPLNDHNGTGKVCVSFPPNAPPGSADKINQVQMAKPSGLRMPSPSMGFFGQKRVASYQSPLQSTSRPYDPSNNPNSRSGGPSKTRCQLALIEHRNFAKVCNGDASGESNLVSGLSSRSSIEPTSCHRRKSISETTNMDKGEVNVVDTSAMNKDLSAHGLENPDVLSLSLSVLQCENASGIHDVIDNQLAEFKPRQMSFNSAGVTPKSFFSDMNDLGLHAIPRALNDQLNRAKDNSEQSSAQVECTNSSDCTFEQISSSHQSLGIKTCNSLKRSRISKDFEHSRFEENVGNDSQAQESCASDKDMFEEEDDNSETKMRILRTRHAETPDTDCCISNECYNTMQSTSTLSSLDSMHNDDEKPKVSVSMLQGISFSETSQCDHASQSNEIVAGGSNGVCGYGSKGDIDLCLISHMAADACLGSEPVISNCNYHPGKIVDIKPGSQRNNIRSELGRKQDDRDVVERLPIDQDLCTSDTENQSYKAQPCDESEHMENGIIPDSHVWSVIDNNQIQNCCTDLVEVSQNSNEGTCLNDELWHKSGSSEEYKEEIVTEGVIGKSDDHIHDVVERLPIARDFCTSDTENRLYNAQLCVEPDNMDDRIKPDSHIWPVIDSNQFQNRCTDLVEVSQNSYKGRMCLNDDFLHTSGTSEEYKEEIVTEGVFGNADPSTLLESRDYHTRILSVRTRSSLPEETQHLIMDNGVVESLEIEATIRRSKCSIAQSSDKVISGEGASVTVKKEMTSEAGPSCNVLTFCSLAEEVENHKPPQINGTILHPNENAHNREVEHLMDTEMCSTNDNCAELQLRKSEDVRKPNALVLKSSTNSVPFSEEWLAAIEAAGEEILTMKSGAVQNSPPDKSQPEPGPWSPVKRKNNHEIGPYDCTKHTNVAQSHESD